MSTIFLTSDIGASKKVNGERVTTKLNNTNHFIENLGKFVTKKDNFVYIASNPSAYNANNSYANITFNSFKISDIEFKNLFILDDRTRDKVDDFIKDADLIFLAGGDTHQQMKFFNNINLSEKLKGINKIIIGQSAGALNLAEEVYCSPEDPSETENAKYFKGLGLTQINIEPHYKSPDKREWKDLQNILLEDSKTRAFIAIADGSYIVETDKYFEIFGDAYKFENGKCHQICRNGQSLKIEKSLSVEKMLFREGNVG